MHFLRTFWLLLSALTLGGCGSVSSFKGLALEEDSVYVSGLPPIKQDKHYACGAACVAAVSAFWNVPPADFRAKHPFLTADTTGQDLQVLATEFGLQAFAYQGSMEDLQENLHQGRPLIVMIPQPLIPAGGLTGAALLNAWDKWGPKPNHWVVVVGLTKDKSVIIHDPASGPMAVNLASFEARWAKKGYLTVLLSAK